MKKGIIKQVLTLILFLVFIRSNAQKNLKLIFDYGFEKDTCTIVVHNKKLNAYETKIDTFSLNKSISSQNILPSTRLNIKYLKGNKYTVVEVIINKRIMGSFGFNNIKDSSTLSIDYKRNVNLRIIELYKDSTSVDAKKLVETYRNIENNSKFFRNKYFI